MEADQRSRRTVVYLTDYDPSAGDSGGKIRDLLWLHLLEPVVSLQKIYTADLETQSTFRASRLLSKFRSYPENGYQQRIVEQLIAAYRDGAILILSRLTQGKYISPAKKIGYKVILDEHNVESHLIGQMLPSWIQSPYRNYLNRRLSQVEKKYCSEADLVFCTSIIDQSLLEKWIPVNKIRVFPNLVALSSYENSASREQRPHLIFSGTLDYFPNEKGLEWFISEVFPILTRLDNNIAQKVVIAGKNPRPSLRDKIRHESIQLIENPLNMKELLARSRVMFVPLLHGGGTRIKILEALASGCTVVSTRKGAEGIPAPEESVIIADDPETFAKKILEHYRDAELYQNARTQARSFIQNFCDLRNYRKPILDAIAGVNP